MLLTGRPLWLNAHINAADAFVVAWLPGSEGVGVADVLVADATDGSPRHDFSGRLSYDWPNKDLNAEDAALPVTDLLFEYGYGLSYDNPPTQLGRLNEQAVGKAKSSTDWSFLAARKSPGASMWATQAIGMCLRKARSPLL